MRQVISVMLIFSALWFPTITSAIILVETNGVSIDGKISSYAPSTALVKVNQDGQLITLPLSSFTAESQETVILWKADKNFKRKSNLSVTLRPSYTESSSNIVGTITDSFTKKEREDTIGTEVRSTCIYNIALKNESDTPFKSLNVDYRIFFTHRLTSDDVGQYQLAGSIERDTLLPGTTWNFKTNPFISSISYQSAPGIRWGGRPFDTGSNVLGILLRVRKPGLSDEWIEQEVEDGEIPRKRDRATYQKIYE
ncbi:hypothetical protein [Tichowtungia aerotolerans]|uniref:Uncharacterized protein n=1 Tax=Tichowtungia aerotolerans TaxID=2697043 RepID=A0A6P1MBV5_9BACT|nr:hypothetical protein [Tichowtungia aerotolerans]QHI70583.1 hypothetical protein GT409_14415 [Tichowtungia aerotolerans]